MAATGNEAVSLQQLKTFASALSKSEYIPGDTIETGTGGRKLQHARLLYGYVMTVSSGSSTTISTLVFLPTAYPISDDVIEATISSYSNAYIYTVEGQANVTSLSVSGIFKNGIVLNAINRADTGASLGVITEGTPVTMLGDIEIELL